jgi:hypothetical protein
MIIKATIFDKVLNGELSPWSTNRITNVQFTDILKNKVRSNKDNPVEYFECLLDALNVYTINISLIHHPTDDGIAKLAKFADLQSKFEILAIPDYYDKASEFYYYLMINERFRLLAALESNVLEGEIDLDKEYQVSSLIRNLNYIIQETSNFLGKDKLCKYVLDILKLSVFTIYEEIRNRYPLYFGDDILAVKEVLNYFCPDFTDNKTNPASIDFFINQYLDQQKQPRKIVIENSPDQSKKPVPEKQPFIPQKSDFRVGKKTKVTYHDVLNQEHFAAFEARLYEYDFIGLNYDFLGIHGKLQELAAIFKILIQKNFFRGKGYNRRYTFKDAHFRQYLDHRYSVDTSQQFRKNSPQFIQSISDKYYWLHTLQAHR